MAQIKYYNDGINWVYTDGITTALKTVPSGKTSLIYDDTRIGNEDINVSNDIPTKIPAKTDVIVSVISTDAAGTGPATCVMRGWTGN